MGLVETLYNMRSISNQTPSLESSVWETFHKKEPKQSNPKCNSFCTWRSSDLYFDWMPIKSWSRKKKESE
jgi:hypothetical protein